MSNCKYIYTYPHTLDLMCVIYLNIKKDFINIDKAKEFLDKAQVNNYRISDKLIREMFNSL